jgi:hypothetical protein
MGTGTAIVSAMFPGRSYRAEYTAADVRYVDGAPVRPTVEVLRFDSPEAVGLVQRSMATERDEETLRALYHGRLAVGDGAFIHLLVSRSITPPVGLQNAKVHADLSISTLLGAGSRATDVIIAQLSKKDAELQIMDLIEGELTPGKLPRKFTASQWRQELFGLLANIRFALADGRGRQLFDYYYEHSGDSAEVERVFKKHPEDAVEQLFDVAVPRAGDDAVTPDQSVLAAQVVRNLGEDALEALGKVLEARGVGLEDFDRAVEKYGSNQVAMAIDAAFDAAREASRGEWIKILDGKILEANQLRKAGKLREALEITEDVLRREPKLPNALKIFPRIVVPLAEKLQNGEAALLLERAAELHPKAKPPLAKQILRGLTDDIDNAVVRDVPHTGGLKLRLIAQGDELPGDPVDADWVEVHFKNKTGYVRRDAVERKGDVWVPKAGGTPFGVLMSVLERILDLDPELETEANKQRGHLNAREFARLVEAGQDTEALAYMEVAQTYAPDDERLAAASGTWWRANKQMVLLVGGFLLVVLVGLGIVAKKIKDELVPSEDLEGQDLEILLEYGVERWDDDGDDDGDDDDLGVGPSAVGGAPADPVAAAAPQAPAAGPAGMTQQPDH